MPELSPSEETAQLSSKAAEGDPDAQFAYGRSLLDGPDGPRGIALVDAAAEQGHADATALCALFEAMGAARPQSWAGALDRLQSAAELGSSSAQEQLRVLASRKAETAPDDDWAKLRSGMSPDILLDMPPRRMLSDAPRIVAFEGFATEAECNWAIARGRDRLERAKVFSKSSGDETYDQSRDNSAIEFQLSQMDVVMELLRARISAATRLPVPIFEPTQVLHYAVGEQFRPHHDYLDESTPGLAEHIRRFGQRIATMLVYLSDDYSGGQTVFPRIGLSYRGNRGDALFFTNVDRSGRGDPLTTHAGTPPTAGEKWVLSQWIRDRAPASPLAAGASAA